MGKFKARNLNSGCLYTDTVLVHSGVTVFLSGPSSGPSNGALSHLLVYPSGQAVEILKTRYIMKAGVFFDRNQ